jgi:hypothetical protein
LPPRSAELVKFTEFGLKRLNVFDQPLFEINLGFCQRWRALDVWGSAWRNIVVKLSPFSVAMLSTSQRATFIYHWVDSICDQQRKQPMEISSVFEF